MNRTRVLIVVAAIIVLAGVGVYLFVSNSGNSNAANPGGNQAAQQFYNERGGGTPIPQMKTLGGNGVVGGPPPLFGTVQQVESSTITVQQQDSSTITVTLAAGGKVTKQETTQLSDIHVGDSVTASGQRQGDTVDASVVQIGGGGAMIMVQAGNGSVPPPADGSANNPDTNSGTNYGTLSPSQRPVSGTVTQIGATSLTLKAGDGTSVTVNLSGNTVIQKQTTVGLTDLQAGDRIVARGTQTGAVYAATDITVLASH